MPRGVLVSNLHCEHFIRTWSYDCQIQREIDSLCFGAQTKTSISLLNLRRIVGVEFLRNKIDSSRIAKHAESTNNTNGLITQVAAVPELFPGVNIADVDFQERDRDSSERIAETHARVGESARVDDDEMDFLACLVDPVNNDTFVVRLEIFDFDSQVFTL